MHALNLPNDQDTIRKSNLFFGRLSASFAGHSCDLMVLSTSILANINNTAYYRHLLPKFRKNIQMQSQVSVKSVGLGGFNNGSSQIQAREKGNLQNKSVL